MIGMNVAKWIAAGALALSVPTVGMARHTRTHAATPAALASFGPAKLVSASKVSTVKTKHHRKLSTARSHRKHTSLHARSHKASKLTKTTKHV